MAALGEKGYEGAEHGPTMSGTDDRVPDRNLGGRTVGAQEVGLRRLGEQAT